MRKIFSIISLCFLFFCSCAGETDSLNSLLKVESDESGPVKGDVIATEVRGDGSFVCLKADGGFFTSAMGGVVEFYLNGVYVARTAYGSQTAPYKLKEIESSINATTLGVGEHLAQCVVMPNIDIKADPNWAGSYCVNNKTGRRDIPCYRSGVYNFRVVSSTSSRNGKYSNRPDGTPACHPNHKEKTKQIKYPCTTIGSALPRKTIPPGTKCYSYRFVTMRKPVVFERFDHVNIRIFEDTHPDCDIDKISSSTMICENLNHGIQTDPSKHKEEINFRTTKCVSLEVGGCHPDGKLYLKSLFKSLKNSYACKNELCDSKGFTYGVPLPNGGVLPGDTTKLPPPNKKDYHNSNSDGLAQAAFFAFYVGEYREPNIQNICAFPQEQFPDTWYKLLSTINVFELLPP